MTYKRFVINLLLLLVCEIYCETYHSYYGRLLTENEREDYENRKVIGVCGKEVEPCSDSEPRRVDGSCNNLQAPLEGTANLPFDRLLPAQLGANNRLSPASDGTPLPLARLVRTTLFPTGVKHSNKFNAAALHFSGFVTLDITTIHGFAGILAEKAYCCTRRGILDPLCIPIKIPKDDPQFAGTDVRCMNMTRAQAFQDLQCVSEDSTREPINFATPLIDLSSVYGMNSSVTATIRTFEQGQLQMESRDNRYLPLSSPSPACFGNQPNETACYKFGQPGSNFDARMTIITIWFMREHNRLATGLAELNPCWSDETVFQTARQINIATLQNIHFYEWLPLMLGKNSLMENKVISATKGYVNDYNPHVKPGIFIEYTIGTRFFHTMIDGVVRGYTPSGAPLGSISFSDQLMRPAILEQGNNLDDLTQGSFRQPMSALDEIIDSDISERFFSQFQRANDLIATDIQRSRDFGIPKYYKYRALCGLTQVKSFDDFLDVMNETVVDNLKILYKSYKDVELIAGIYNERPLSGAFVGPTLHCIMTKQSLSWRTGDRFWFEHGLQEGSFTEEQLAEIRKTTIASVACSNGDTIENVQPQGFLLVGTGNEQVPCSNIPTIDLTKWDYQSCVEKHN